MTMWTGIPLSLDTITPDLASCPKVRDEQRSNMLGSLDLRKVSGGGPSSTMMVADGALSRIRGRTWIH
jgi:hypothetical protein